MLKSSGYGNEQTDELVNLGVVRIFIGPEPKVWDLKIDHGKNIVSEWLGKELLKS